MFHTKHDVRAEFFQVQFVQFTYYVTSTNKFRLSLLKNTSVTESLTSANIPPHPSVSVNTSPAIPPVPSQQFRYYFHSNSVTSFKAQLHPVPKLKVLFLSPFLIFPKWFWMTHIRAIIFVDRSHSPSLRRLPPGLRPRLPPPSPSPLSSRLRVLGNNSTH